MKISYSKYPILEKLKNKSLGKIPIIEEDASFFELNMKAFIYQWKRYADKFSDDVNILTKPFTESIEKSMDKLMNLYKEICIKDHDNFMASGTFIVGNICYMIYQEFKSGSEDITTALFVFGIDGMPICLFVDDDDYHQNGWISKRQNIKPGFNTKEVNGAIYTKVGQALSMYMFKRYADIETKHLAPGQKIKGIECNYKNETKLSVTILNSTWFTNLVKSDAFKVRGHFRLQPCGHELKNRKLIWINEFMKGGYTAPARKLNNENKSEA